MRLVKFVCLLSLVSASASSYATTVTWNGVAETDGNASISVTPFTANTFTGASGSATFGQEPGVQQAALLQVELQNGSYVTVASTAYGAVGKLSTLFTPSTFTGGTIIGLRLIDQDLFGDQYNDDASTCSFYGGCIQNLTAESFSFSQVTPVSVTPEPSSILLLGTGLLGVADVIRKRLV